MLRVEQFVRATHSGCAEGHRPFAEDSGVSPNLNSLESLFDKEGLREFVARVVRQAPPRWSLLRSL